MPHLQDAAPFPRDAAGPKYRLDPSDRITLTAEDGETLHYTRAVLLRDLPARTPKGETGREDVPRGIIPAGSKGAYVTHDDAISQKGDAWAGPDVRIALGGRVRDDAQVWGGSHISGQASGSAWLYSTDLDLYAHATGNTVAIGSVLASATAHDARLEGARLLHSSVRQSTVRDTTADHARITDSQIAGAVLTPTRPMEEHGSDLLPIFYINSSNLFAVEFSATPPQGVGTTSGWISDSHVTRVSGTDPQLLGVTIDGERAGLTIRLDDRITARLAQAWINSLPTGADAADLSPLGMMIDPKARVAAGDFNPDWIRHHAVLALKAGDPDITRYIDTLALHDPDYGVIEATLADPGFRRGMAEAFAAMPGIVVAGQFRRESAADALRSMVSGRHWNMPLLDALPRSALPGIRRLHDDPGIGAHPLRFDGQTIDVIAVTLQHSVMRRGDDPLYEAAFVPVSSIVPGDPSAMRFITVGNAASAFERPERAADFARAVLHAGGGIIPQPEGGLPVPNPRAPILTHVRLADAASGPDPLPLRGPDGPPAWWTALSVLDRKALVAAAQVTQPGLTLVEDDGWGKLPETAVRDLRATYVRIGMGAAPKAVFEFQAAPVPRTPKAAGLTLHEGFQTAIVAAIKHPDDATPLIHPDALDGALPTPSAALRVAERRVETGRGWGWEQAPRYVMPELNLQRVMAASPQKEHPQAAPAP